MRWCVGLFVGMTPDAGYVDPLQGYTASSHALLETVYWAKEANSVAWDAFVYASMSDGDKEQWFAQVAACLEEHLIATLVVPWREVCVRIVAARMLKEWPKFAFKPMLRCADFVYCSLIPSFKIFPFFSSRCSRVNRHNHPFALAMRLIAPSLVEEPVKELIKYGEWALMWALVQHVQVIALVYIDLVVASLPQLQRVPAIPAFAWDTLAALAMQGMSASLTTLFCTSARDDIAGLRAKISRVVLPRTPKDLSSLWRGCVSPQAREWLLAGISKWKLSDAYCTLLLVEEASLFDGKDLSLFQWAWETATGDTLRSAVERMLASPECIEASLASLQHALNGKWKGVDTIEVGEM